MHISYKWLKEFIDIKGSASHTASLLTMAGIETEAVTSALGEEILAIEITPNRGDCLSVLGIARELSAILNIPLKGRRNNEDISEIWESPCGFQSDISIHIDDKEICSRYTGIVIKDIKIAGSPDWLKSRLASSGIRELNNVVDITNYVQLELGQPLHAFDLSKLIGNTIHIKKAGRDSSIKTIDKETRRIPEDGITISDEVRPIAIGGIMGGFETEITNETTDIFIESAYFNPALIRTASKRLGFKTESSYRFERGTDILMVAASLKRAATLVLELCGGNASASEIIDVYPIKYQPTAIVFDKRDVKRLLGINIEDEEIDRILKALEFQINEDNTITPPSYRGDIELPADIIEEVSRIYGYDKIPSIMPKSEITLTKKENRIIDRFLIMDYMRHAGFTEVINYSFMASDSLKGFNLYPDDKRQTSSISIKNPLRKDHTLMRTFILPSLINNLVYNLNHGVEEINIYELSKIFIKRRLKPPVDKEDVLPDEQLTLSGLSFSSQGIKIWSEPAGLFYQIKGVLQGLFETFRLNDYSFKPSIEPYLFKGQALDIYYGEIKVGYMGILSPQVVTNIDINTKNPIIAVFSVDIDIFLGLQKEKLKYTLISKYPAVNRDIAIIVDSSIRAGDIEELIRRYPDKLISDAKVFDSYAGKNIPKGKKNLAFHVTYQSYERTLLDHEIDALHKDIVNYIIDKTGGILRGN